LQSFGLIVTAEPYFAVTQPSDVVVMENFVRPDTIGTIEQVDAKYELSQRGQYVLNVNPADIKPLRLNSKVPWNSTRREMPSILHAGPARRDMPQIRSKRPFRAWRMPRAIGLGHAAQSRLSGNRMLREN